MRVQHRLCAIFILSSLYCGNSLADETRIGLGTNVLNFNILNIPIVTGEFLIEPYLKIYQRNINRPDARATYADDDYEVVELGVGVFRHKLLAGAASLYSYSGLRASYFKVSSSSRYVYTDLALSNRTLKSSGYALAPTIGLDYFVTNNMSVSSELEVRFDNESGSTTIDGVKYSGINESYVRSRASLIFRYYYN